MAVNLCLEEHEEEILIEYRQFTLVKIVDVDPQIQAEGGRSSWIECKDERLYFKSAAPDHYAAVRLQHWNGEPPVNRDFRWEEFDEFRIMSANDTLSIWTVTMGPGGLQIALEPGWYHMRALSTGRKAISRKMRDHDLTQGFPRSVERYLLQIWAAE
ncbi:hypothetical protein [Actinomadura macra]|uniref:hypothetical protein n=1 Tax=Actinomadura macra TaxID=46164 RepID=UPI0012F9787B|nr:hypothetical protein [Actinomadura macra]